MKGIVTIEIRNKDTLELEDTVVKENIITREFTESLISTMSLQLKVIITSAVYEPSVYVYAAHYPNANGHTITAKNSDIPNVPSSIFFPKTETSPAFIQYSARFTPPPAGTTRTTSTVLLSSTDYFGGYTYDRKALAPRAFAKLAVPCIQTDTQVFDVYYRVFFDYDQDNSDMHYVMYEEFLKRFDLPGSSATYSHYTSPFKRVQYMPWPPISVPASEKSTVMVDSAGIGNQMGSVFSMSPTQTEYGCVGDYEYGFNSMVGQIIAGNYFTNEYNERLIVAQANYTGKFNKIQNLIGNREELTTNVSPFLNVDNLPDSTGKISVSGTWNNTEPTSNTDLYFKTKFPEWNKIQITESGAVGVSKYKYTVQPFVGLNAFESADNITIYRPQQVQGLCATISGVITAGKSVLGDVSDVLLGAEQISAVTAYDDTSVIYPKKNSIVLYSIPAARYWRITGAFTNIHQVAVANNIIYIACRDTGLWSVNPRVSLAATNVTVQGTRVADFSKCHGVAVGYNNVVWAVGQDALASFNGSTWTIYDSTTTHPFGVSTAIFSNIEYIKADSTIPGQQLMIVNRQTNSSTNLGWWWSETTTLKETGQQPALSGMGRPRVHRGHILPHNGKWAIVSNGRRIYLTDFNSDTFTVSSGVAPSNDQYINQMNSYKWVTDPDNNSYFMHMPGTSSISGTLDSNSYRLTTELIRPNGTVYDTMSGTRSSLIGGSIFVYTYSRSQTSNDYVYQGYVPLAGGLMFATTKRVSGEIISWVYQTGLESHPHGGVNRWLATKQYGWDGTTWVLNASQGKNTHSTLDNLLDGISVKFEDGTAGTSFSVPNYWKFGLCDGLFKDNATRARFKTPHYIAKNMSSPPVLSSTTVPALASLPTGVVSINLDKSSNNVSVDSNGNVVFPGNNSYQFAVGDKQVTGDFELLVDASMFTTVTDKGWTAVGVGKIANSIHPLISISSNSSGVLIIRNSDASTVYTYTGSTAISSAVIKRLAGTISVIINGVSVYTLPAARHRVGDQRLDIIFYTKESYSAIPANTVAPKATILANGQDNAVFVGSASSKTDYYDVRFRAIDTTVPPTGKLDGVTVPVKTDGTLPSAGEISLDAQMGVMYFNIADQGKSVSLECTRIYIS